MMAAARFPLWLKAGCTAFVVVLVPVYWWRHGPANFLWFSDIALFGSVVVLWTGNRLLASTMAVAVLLPEAAWNVDFLVRLFTDRSPLGLANYMWDDSIAPAVRALSLFHVALPLVLLWEVWRLGYDRRAWWVQTLVAWGVLPATWALTGPEENINWVYGLGEAPQRWVPQPLYVLGLMLAFPLAVYLPTHAILRRIDAWRKPERVDGRR